MNSKFKPFSQQNILEKIISLIGVAAVAYFGISAIAGMGNLLYLNSSEYRQEYLKDLEDSTVRTHQRIMEESKEHYGY
jgi:hypothetical protein